MIDIVPMRMGLLGRRQDQSRSYLVVAVLLKFIQLAMVASRVDSMLEQRLDQVGNHTAGVVHAAQAAFVASLPVAAHVR